jgi:hypothetical protein
MQCIYAPIIFSVIRILFNYEFFIPSVKLDLDNILFDLLHEGTMLNPPLINFLVVNFESINISEDIFNTNFPNLANEIYFNIGLINQINNYVNEWHERIPRIRRHNLPEKFREYLRFYDIDILPNFSEYIPISSKVKFINQINIDKTDIKKIKLNVDNFVECIICVNEEIIEKEVCITCFSIICNECYEKLTNCPFCRGNLEFHSIIQKLQF